MLLTNTELDKLNFRLDSQINLQEIFSYPRQLVLMNLLIFYEDFNRLYSSGDKGSFLNGHNCIGFAINWVYKYCPHNDSNCEFLCNEKIYTLAGKLFELAKDYSDIWVMMSLLYRGHYVGDIEDNSVTLTCVDPVCFEYEIMATVTGDPDDYSDIKKLKLQGMATLDYLKNISIQKIGKQKIRYDLSVEDFQDILNFQKSIHENIWHLDPKMSLGKYLIEEYTIFWETLATISLINIFCCTTSGVMGGALNSVVIFKSIKNWILFISKYSLLNQKIVELIINDLKFSQLLIKPENSAAVFQPFFQLHGDIFALSPSLVMLSNAERNIWALTNFLNPSAHSIIRNKTEKYWLNQLIEFFKKWGLLAVGSFNINYMGKSTDIDLLVIDEKSKFALTVELKFLKNPDMPNEVDLTNTELSKGMKQAQICFDWLNGTKASLNKLTKRKDLLEYEIQALVLSKNTIGSIPFLNSEIPISNEKLLKWVIGEPHKKTLKDFWLISKKRSYAPIEGKHYKNADMDIQFFDLKFSGKNFGYNFTDHAWGSEDIKF